MIGARSRLRACSRRRSPTACSPPATCGCPARRSRRRSSPGLAAQILARHPAFTPDQVKGALMLTAKRAPLATTLSLGVGEVDAAAAAALTNPPNPNKNLYRFVRTDADGNPSFDWDGWNAYVGTNASWTNASWTDASLDRRVAGRTRPGRTRRWTDASLDGRVAGRTRPGPTPPGRTRRGPTRAGRTPTDRGMTFLSRALPLPLAGRLYYAAVATAALSAGTLAFAHARRGALELADVRRARGVRGHGAGLHRPHRPEPRLPHGDRLRHRRRAPASAGARRADGRRSSTCPSGCKERYPAYIQTFNIFNFALAALAAWAVADLERAERVPRQRHARRRGGRRGGRAARRS